MATSNPTRPDLDAVGTMVTEGQDFYQRHAATLGDTAATWGGMLWGLMRAIAACPPCPGVYRVPQDDAWQTLICPRCHGVWVKRDDAAA